MLLPLRAAPLPRQPVVRGRGSRSQLGWGVSNGPLDPLSKIRKQLFSKICIYLIASEGGLTKWFLPSPFKN